MKNGLFLALTLGLGLGLPAHEASAMPCDVSSSRLICQSKSFALKAHYCGLSNGLRSSEIQGLGLPALTLTSEWDGSAFSGFQALTNDAELVLLVEVNNQSREAIFSLYKQSEESPAREKTATEVGTCKYVIDEVAP